MIRWIAAHWHHPHFNFSYDGNFDIESRAAQVQVASSHFRLVIGGNQERTSNVVGIVEGVCGVGRLIRVAVTVGVALERP